MIIWCKSDSVLSLLFLGFSQISEWTHYLKGFAFEKLGCADSIKIMGGHLLKYSSLKFSSKFHGQREFDFNDQIYTFQRQYAINYYLNREQTHFEPCIFWTATGYEACNTYK